MENNTTVSRNPAKFLIFSTIGILYFFVPLVTVGESKITWLVHSVNLVKGWLKPFLPTLVLIWIAMLIVCCIVAKVSDKFPLITKLYGSVRPYSIVLYAIGFVSAVMVYLKVGPEMILSPSVGGTGMSLSQTVIVTIIIAGLMVVFVTDFGLLELIGVIIEPLMRPMFKVPGYASIDAVTSFVANPTVGVFFTNKLYMQKRYTSREASSIASGFSFISLGFFMVLAQTANIFEYYGQILLWSFVMAFVLAFIMVRIPPLSRIPDTMYDGTERPAEERERFSMALLKKGWETAAMRGNELNIAEAFKKTLVDVFIFSQKISAYIMCITVITMLLVENTFIFNYLGIPFIPILNLLQIPNAAEIAPSFILGLAEVALPATYISTLGVAPAAAFFVVVVTALQIIMFSNSAVSIMESNIPLNAGKLIIIFFLRTLISMPFVAVITHIIF